MHRTRKIKHFCCTVQKFFLGVRGPEVLLTILGRSVDKKYSDDWVELARPQVYAYEHLPCKDYSMSLSLRKPKKMQDLPSKSLNFEAFSDELGEPGGRSLSPRC